MNSPSPSDIQCLRCRSWTPPLAVCSHCGAPLDLAPEQRKLSLITTPKQTAIASGLTAAFFAMWFAGAAEPDLPGWAYALLGSFAFALLAGIVFLFARRRANSKLRNQALAFMEATPLQTVRGAGEGRVRLRGVAHPVSMARSPAGEPCVAFERRVLGPEGSVEVRSEGSLFELDDGSGARARVHAEWVGVPAGQPHAGGVRIPPGARVEIVGAARWMLSRGDADPQAASLRETARFLEVVGTPQDPVLVRLLDAGATAAPAPSPAGVMGSAAGSGMGSATGSAKASAVGSGSRAGGTGVRVDPRAAPSGYGAPSGYDAPVGVAASEEDAAASAEAMRRRAR